MAARMLAARLACLPGLAVATELPPRLLPVISKTEQAPQLRAPDSFARLVAAPLGPDPHEGRASRTRVKGLQIGRGTGITMDTSDKRAFVLCPPDGVVAVIAPATRHEVEHIAVARPDGEVHAP